MMGVSFQSRTTVAYRAIHIGQPVADELFSFTPPTNAKEVSELPLPGTSARRALTGQPGPDFTLPTLEGKKTSLSDFKGKIVLLDFWATWCVPCRESTPLIEKVNSAFSSKGLVTLAVDYGEEPAVAKGYLAHNPSSLPNLVDPSNTVRLTSQILQCCPFPHGSPIFTASLYEAFGRLELCELETLTHSS